MGKEMNPFKVHHKVPQLNLPKPPTPDVKNSPCYAIDQKWLNKRLDELERQRAFKKVIL